MEARNQKAFESIKAFEWAAISGKRLLISTGYTNGVTVVLGLDELEKILYLLHVGQEKISNE